MRCPKCDADLAAQARFCGVCGHQLPAAAGKGILKAPPGAPTLAPDPDSAPMSGSPPPAARPRGKQVGMPRSEPQAAPDPDTSRPLPSYLEGDPYLDKTLNGRFKVEGKLGEGGFGAVYRGVQTGTGREVALKLLHPEMTRDKNVLARFRREGEVLCQLRDAHTITTYDFDQTEDGTLFIAMELLGGKSLHDLFQDEAPLAWDRMLKLVVQMCSSLQEAHQLGIVHRDLKPENIYLEERPGNPEYVKILDFGIAKVVRGDAGEGGAGAKQIAQLTATGQTLGTLEYMSPEQLMGKQLDGRSDVYAVGVLCYEMMTGQLPFPDAVGPAAQIAAQLKKTPRRPSEVRPEMDIPASVDEVVLRCLGKRPGDRFADVAELRRACETILDRHERGEAALPGSRTTPPPGSLDAGADQGPAAPQPATAGQSSGVPQPTPAPAPSAPVPLSYQPPPKPAPARQAPGRGKSSTLLWVILAVVIALGAAAGAFFALQ